MSTAAAILKIDLHCKGCIKQIEKATLAFKGVHSVSIDTTKSLVTVHGSMDVEDLRLHLRYKLTKEVEILKPTTTTVVQPSVVIVKEEEVVIRTSTSTSSTTTTYY